ncbi:hypothetical protein [Roseibacillus ishigakijimensis]|uniref:Uncharacterized protein n=1 Tax=Roseibacillus ishigakijimensis TaxID=454146 RepID=A0A934RMS1_9BACT|nr:hypothetical protein [Roseibacillus ishigakijimensis]
MSSTVGREERLALFQRSALLGDIGRQATVLCELIETADSAELEEMTRLLKQAQDRGNAWDQEVWNELWKQWGRMDPVRCLELAGDGQGMSHGGDYEQMMAGWIEVDRLAAKEWVDSLPRGYAETGVAAYFVAEGDFKNPEEMGAAILEATGDLRIRAASIHRYLDFCVSQPELSLVEAYERTPEELRPLVAGKLAERISYQDPEAAAQWLLAHSDEGGLGSQTFIIVAGKLPASSGLRSKLLSIHQQKAFHE